MKQGAKKRVVLGVCGSIAAYKAVELLRGMQQKEWDVWVMMTAGAARFITPLTFQALTFHPVPVGTGDEVAGSSYQHLDLAACDAVVVAPCTANVIAKMALGLADDIVSATVLSTQAPRIVAPAMNVNMWTNAATQENVRTLIRRGFHVVDVAQGRLACGTEGKGRLAPLPDILAAVETSWGR